MIETTIERAQNEVERLTACPAVADVYGEYELEFLQEVAHWSAKGYRLDQHSLQSFRPGNYYVLMFAPS